MSRGSLSKARWAALRRDYSTAGDFYRLGGRLDHALKMYQKGRHHRLAGEVAVQLGQVALAAKEYEKGGMHREAAEMSLRAGNREAAARQFVQGNQCRRAAQVHEECGNSEAAAALYEHSGDFLQAARLFLEARQPDGASRCLETVIKDGALGGDQSELLTMAVRIGQQLLATGQPERSARWLEYAGRKKEAAGAWERAGQPEKALKALLEAGLVEQAADLAEKHGPETIDSTLAAEAYRAASRWAEAASLYLESGRPSEAARCLEQLGCNAEAAWAHEAAGDLIAAAAANEQAGEFASAGDQYRQAGAMADAGRCMAASGQLEEAAACYAGAGDQLRAAELHEERGDLDAAVVALQSISPKSEEAIQAALQLARCFERMGVDSVAADHYRRALAESESTGPTSDPDPWYSLATVLERAGRVREAAQAFSKVVAIDYSFKDASRRLAAIEERLNRGSPAQGASAPRTSVPERFAVEKALGGYLHGQAFLAADKVMERRVVLRRFGADLVPNESAADRLLMDIRRIARLHHPAIAAIHDAGQEASGVYVVEEYAAGQTLRQILEREGALDVPRTVQVLTRIAEALDYAHGLGLLARNLRPEHVIISPSWEAQLVDFGFAFRHADGGSPDNVYRPPEARKGERMDPSSDIYLLGVLAWEMLVGSPPPVPTALGADPPQIPVNENKPVPDLLRRVIQKCLVPDRGVRLGSAQKLLEELHGTNLLPGALLANRYEILREIGRGGMGTVFAARDLVLEEPVALKVLAGPLDETIEKRFIQEIRLTRQINHPNIVRVHTFERWRELRFIVMEYIDGVDLRKWSESRRPIPLGQVLDFVHGVASGLAAAHRLGIVHRDVKPENVLLDPEGKPRLVDFGIARQGDVHLTREGLVMGSPAYMAPEQIRGEAADQRADLYALGVLAYFLIVGREPFASDNVAEVLRLQIEEAPPPLSEFRPGIPAPVEALIARLLTKDPNQRPPSIFAFLDELTHARNQLNVVVS